MRRGSKAIRWSGAGVALLAVVPALAVLAAPKRAATRIPAAPVSFNRDIRPILSDNCFTCHGPDSAARKAGLRLDLQAEAMARGVLSPGKPDQSRLLLRVFSKNPTQVMPPVNSHKSLSAVEKDLLRRWIAQGAKYEPHWSFVPLPKSVPVPATKDQAWPRNEIDLFVLARLEKAGLRPSKEASRSDWLRRVTFDLTGLPPNPKEADEFLGDKSPQAYEKVVDRLLASPRYGEQMAAPWLDVARYGDSYGYQSDQLSPTWPYRDWVVKAFNENLPYDQFLTQQIAGDLLPNATREQRLATAFNRLHRMTNEGGSVPEEWRLEGVADRVHTFGTAALGMTFECARCHDHKYDPLSQRDYYSLSAFFNSIDEHGLYDAAHIVPTPSLLLPTPEQEKQLGAAVESAAVATNASKESRASREGAFKQWLTTKPAAVLPDMTGRFDFEMWYATAARNLVPGSTLQGARLDEVPLVEGKVGTAAQLDGENNVNFPDLGRFTRHTPFTIAFWMRDARQAAEPCVVFQACSGTDTGPYGYDLLLQDGHLTARMMRHWPGNAIAVRTRHHVIPNEWTHVAVTYDGSSRALGLKIYLNGKAPEVEIVRDHLYKGTGQHALIFGQRFRDKGFKGGRIDELAIFDRDITPLEVAQLHDGTSLAEALAAPAAHEAVLREYYFSAIDPEVRVKDAEVEVARQKIVAVEDAQFEVPVMLEMPQPRPAYLLARGAYDAPKTDADRVQPSTPAAILGFPKDLPRNRLGLAKWTVDPGNPLTARVAVNRFWELLFGRGLVETTENLGSQGKQPTHPELLDHLALRFSLRGWDVKALLKTIVLSSTYRQASALRAELKERDPANLLLARGPSGRLSAEEIRDLALAASGLLDERRGGPPVSPYQPGDLWREANSMSPAYRQSVGTDLYRRSLYTVWKRTAPPPNMLAFDSTTREYCVARRQTTNTPLQALVLLNDPQFLEASRVLGEKMLKEGGASTADRVRWAFRRLATREPTTQEREALVSLFDRQKALYAQDPAAATKLITVGASKPDAALSPAEVAAATVVAQGILNLDAAIWKR